MDERFERELRAGLADLLDPVTERHPRWESSPAAGQVVGAHARRGFSGRYGLLWAAAIVGLLLAGLLGAAALVGARRPDHAVVVAPSPSVMTVDGEGTDILATTRANPLPAQATCPPGSDPDAPGAVDQDRPVGYWLVTGLGAMAFDRHAGRIVMVAEDERYPDGQASVTWTYDVCTNRWQRMSPGPALARPGPDSPVRLIYDADSNRTLAFTNLDAPDGIAREVWSYALAADRWTKLGAFPLAAGGRLPGQSTPYGTIFYHDPSGLVVLHDGTTMWAYDVDANTLARVRQRPDSALFAGAGLPQGRIALGYDPGHDLVVAVVVPYVGSETGQPSGQWGETWTFDPGSGTWRKEAVLAPADLIVCGTRLAGECVMTNGRSVFDEASNMVLFMNRDEGTERRRVDTFDVGQRAWRTVALATTSAGRDSVQCSSKPPVYDPLNGRIVCLGPDNPDGAPGVSAFTAGTVSWRWLLVPTSTPPPAPTPAPGATPIGWGTPPP